MTALRIGARRPAAWPIRSAAHRDIAHHKWPRPESSVHPDARGSR